MFKRNNIDIIAAAITTKTINYNNKYVLEQKFQSKSIDAKTYRVIPTIKTFKLMVDLKHILTVYVFRHH